MTVTQELRHQHHDLWHRMVTHPFVIELGEGTLPVEKLRTYFLQDYVFVRDLVTMTALGLAKAPTFLAASLLNQFLTGILNPENDLFVRAFNELGVPEAVYMAASAAPVTQAFGDFMVRTGLEGSFEDIVTVLYVTEGTYLDWGSRLLEAGKSPSQAIYREWIEIHSPQVLGAFVAGLSQYLDSAELEGHRPRIERIFHTTLRYEYLFWEGAYHGSALWPD
jgi:thiaminase/transcriptional activator TenA